MRLLPLIAALIAAIAVALAAGGARALTVAPDRVAQPEACPDGNPSALLRLDLSGPRPRSEQIASDIWRHGGYPLDVSPDGRWFLYSAGGKDLRVRPVAGGSSRLLATEPPGAYALKANWSPDGKRIAFVTISGGGRTPLWVVGADGSGLQKVADDGSVPTWSPDSRRLAFFRSRKRLIVTRADGSRSLDVAPAFGPDGPPVWSPRGDWIAYPGIGARTLDLIRPDGSGHRVLGGGLYPSWAPRGNRIVSNHVYNYDGGNAQDAFAIRDLHGHLLHSIEYGQALFPSWSPLDDQIVYAALAGKLHDGRDQLWSIRANGTRAHQLTHDRELPGIVLADDIERLEWVTKGPRTGKQLFYFRNFCDDDTD